MRIKLPVDIQKNLVENYKNKSNLDWQTMANLLKVGASTLRSRYRFGSASLPIEVFEKFVEDLPEKEQKSIREKGKIIKRNFNTSRSDALANSNRKKAAQTIKSRYGASFFSSIGSKGANISKLMWDDARRIRQSSIGKRGGRERIKRAKYLTKQEEQIAEENMLLNLNFESNHFITEDLNFDFVYFEADKPIAVEEVTCNIFRSFTYILKKREILNDLYGVDFPFILTVNSTARSKNLLRYLLCKNIHVFVSLKERRKFIRTILCQTHNEDTLKQIELRWPIKHNMQCSMRGAKAELLKPMDNYEKLVHRALEQLDLKPQGKHLLSNEEFSVVPDNRFYLDSKPVNVFVSYCNSRGSLFYIMYRTATYGYLVKNIFNEKTMSVLFDFSNTASGLGDNVPKNLWKTNCTYPMIIFKKSVDDLVKSINMGLLDPVA